MRVLLLQGPVGPLFAQLARAMTARGWAVDRIVLDGGDRLFGKGAVWMGGDFTSWLEDRFTTFRPDAVVLFGAERPAHRIARHIAHQRTIPVLCLEEGYRRPGYITAEWGGNNHQSPTLSYPLPAHPLPPGRPRAPVPAGMKSLIGWSFITYAARALLSRPAQRSLHHRQHHSLGEAVRWGRNLWVRAQWKSRDKAALECLASSWAGVYDVLALQVPGDLALVHGGLGWTSERFLDAALQSFSRHAPAERRLVVKIHPLARGHSDHILRAQAQAEALGIASRVAIITSGPLAPVLAHARGLATVTSTSAIASIERGLTTLVMGRGVASRPELAICGPEPEALDQFWTAKPRATRAQAAAFRALLDEHALLAGDAYHRSGRRQAIAGIIDRIAKIRTGA